MKRAFILLIFLHVLFLINGQPNKQLEIKLLVFKFNKLINIYGSSLKEKVIAKIEDDTISENYYWFDVWEKKDSMLKVTVWSTKSKTDIKGWIKITDCGMFIRPRNRIFYIYERPDYKSYKLKISDIFADKVKVLDFNGQWLRIEIKYKNKFIRYWLPYEYQCDDVFYSCT